MTLEQYLSEHEESISDFAKRMGKKDWTIRRYIAGARPCAKMMIEIYQATNSLVAPNDWFGLENSQPKEISSFCASRFQMV